MWLLEAFWTANGRKYTQMGDRRDFLNEIREAREKQPFALTEARRREGGAGEFNAKGARGAIGSQAPTRDGPVIPGPETLRLRVSVWRFCKKIVINIPVSQWLVQRAATKAGSLFIAPPEPRVPASGAGPGGLKAPGRLLPDGSSGWWDSAGCR